MNGNGWVGLDLPSYGADYASCRNALAPNKRMLIHVVKRHVHYYDASLTHSLNEWTQSVIVVCGEKVWVDSCRGKTGDIWARDIGAFTHTLFNISTHVRLA